MYLKLSIYRSERRRYTITCIHSILPFLYPEVLFLCSNNLNRLLSFNFSFVIMANPANFIFTFFFFSTSVITDIKGRSMAKSYMSAFSCLFDIYKHNFSFTYLISKTKKQERPTCDSNS